MMNVIQASEPNVRDGVRRWVSMETQKHIERTGSTMDPKTIDLVMLEFKMAEILTSEKAHREFVLTVAKLTEPLNAQPKKEK
jgi:hypothetical protein